MTTHPLQTYLNETQQTAGEFALKANLSEQAIYKIINRERKRPRPDTIKKITKASGGKITIYQLLGIAPNGDLEKLDKQTSPIGAN